MIAFVLRWEWETIVQQIGYPSPVQPPVRMEVSYSFQEKIQVLLLPIKSSMQDTFYKNMQKSILFSNLKI